MSDRNLLSIQALRGFAAMAVVWAHCLAAMGHSKGIELYPNWNIGTIGVDIFFVISGVVMAGLMSAPRGRLAFLWARFRRVVPLYWFWSIPFLIRSLALGHPIVHPLLSTFFYPFHGDGFEMPVLGIGWTLIFEMAFYLGLALLIRRPAWCITVAMVLLAFAVCLNLLGRRGIFLVIGSPLILEFLAGFAFGRLRHAPNQRFGLLCIGAATAVLVAILSGNIWPLYDAETVIGKVFVAWRRVVTWGPFALILVIGAVNMEETFRRKYLRPLKVIGDASYSIYLTHWLIIIAIDAFGHFLPWWMIPTIGVAAALCVGLLAYRFVEVPLLSWLKQQSRLESAPSPASSSIA